MKKKHIQLFSDGSINFFYLPITKKKFKQYKIYKLDMLTFFFNKKNKTFKNLGYLNNNYKKKYII